MSLARLPGSRIVAVPRAAFARPDTEFLCFGESDWSAPPGAAPALAASLAAGPARYPDVRGDPALRQALADHHGVDKISFTGSTLTGRKILKAAADSNLKDVSLELGGKSPAIIFNDADLEQTVKWVSLGIL